MFATPAATAAFDVPIGKHCILELYGCPSHKLDDAILIRQAMRNASEKSMSTLLHLSSHKFDPQGVTALALLAESHISVHTWPEHGYASVDIYTCGAKSQPVNACLSLVAELEAGSYALKVLPRGLDNANGLQVPLRDGATHSPIEEDALCPVPN